MKDMSFYFNLIEIPEDEDFASLKYLFYKIGFKDALSNKKIIGSIQEKKDTVSIQLLKDSIELKKCRKVEIRFEGYEGQLMYEQAGSYWKLSLGDRNTIKIETKVEKKEFYVWLKNKKEKKSLKKLINWCYENNIQIKEYYRGKRTFKWKQVNYETIQKIKEKYKLLEW